jgi:hypothetical protein
VREGEQGRVSRCREKEERERRKKRERGIERERKKERESGYRKCDSIVLLIAATF